MEENDIERAFEGRTVLDSLLTASGSLADTEDVASAMTQAIQEEVPPAAVIEALWDDEPRFSSPQEAARLFGNLLGLYDLIANGRVIDLSVAAARQPKRKAERPGPLGADGPDDAYLQAALEYLVDFPKEKQRFEHMIENRQDALLSWLDGTGLSDEAFGLARQLLAEVFAVLELGGRTVPSLSAAQCEAQSASEPAPPVLLEWLEDALLEAGSDETQPLGEAEIASVRKILGWAVGAMAKA
jgi:hypothetical protein